jgi:acyl-CoA thioesterase-1
MIEKLRATGSKVILLTPMPIITRKLDDPDEPLVQHASDIRELSEEYEIGLADCFGAAQRFVREGNVLETLMVSNSHPNAKGQAFICKQLLPLFLPQK